MQTEFNPKRIERNILFMQSRDGMLDMFFGLMLAIAGINDIYSYYGWQEVWYLRFGIIILIVPFLLGKFFITTPRLGYVKMKPVVGGRRLILIIFLSISLTFTCLLLAGVLLKLPGFRGESVAFNPIIEFGFLVITSGFVAWLMGTYSLFFAGLAAGFAWPIADMINLKTIAGFPAEVFTLCLPGLIIFVYGLVIFVKFLKSHPRKNLKADYEPQD